MTSPDLAHVVVVALCSVAPDVSPEEIDQEAPLREQVELDSMDFLNFVAALYEATGVDVPEGDYDELDSIASATRYLGARRTSAPTIG
jgi:acyl carrier protein